MKKILLASAGVMVMSAGTGYAACIPTPSCSSLGYESSSSCEGGIKCPFGNAWNCTVINKVNEIEKVIKETGSGGNKNCAVGNIYYSDKTCSAFLDSSKTPIGVVVYVDGQGHGQVMALNIIGRYVWQEKERNDPYIDITSLTNYTDAETASYDLNSCANTKKIIAAGDKSLYPAAWAAHEYFTAGTSPGDWCLPAAGIFTFYYNNPQLINIGFTRAGATLHPNDGWGDRRWSSTEASANGAWHYTWEDTEYGIALSEDSGAFVSKEGSLYVHPVLEF